MFGFPDYAGAISWGTATPMDVVKSRIQADGVYLNKYRGVLDCISQSYQQEGFKVSSTQPSWVSSRLAEGLDLWWFGWRRGLGEQVLEVTSLSLVTFIPQCFMFYEAIVDETSSPPTS